MKIYFTLRKNFFVLLIDMNLVTKLHSITTSFCYTCALRLKSALLPAIIFFNSYINNLKGSFMFCFDFASKEILQLMDEQYMHVWLNTTNSCQQVKLN